MKILIVSSLYNPYIGGGAEISTQILAEGLVKKGIEVDVMTAGYNDSNEIINGVKIIRKDFGKRSKKILDASKVGKGKYKLSKFDTLSLKLSSYFINSLKKYYHNILKEGEYTIVHTTNNMNFMGANILWRTAKKLKIKVVHSLRDPALLALGIDIDTKKSIFDGIYRRFCNKWIKYIDIVHSPSNYMIKLHEKYGLMFNRTITIPNTVNIEKNFVDNKKENTIIYVGAVSRHKGILTLIKAFEKNEKLNDFKLILLGEGDLSNELAAKYETSERIKLYGWRKAEDVYEMISKSKLLVLPSEWEETFGRTIIEAVFCGTLALGSNRGGIPEVLDNNDEYIFTAGDSDELAEKMEKIIKLSDVEYAGCLKKVMEKMDKFKLENHINIFIDTYKHI